MDAFQQDEYRALHEAALQHGRAKWEAGRMALTAATFVVGGLATYGDDLVSTHGWSANWVAAAWLIPLVIALAAYSYDCDRGRRADRIASYIRVFLEPDDRGWHDRLERKARLPHEGRPEGEGETEPARAEPPRHADASGTTQEGTGGPQEGLERPRLPLWRRALQRAAMPGAERLTAAVRDFGEHPHVFLFVLVLPCVFLAIAHAESELVVCLNGALGAALWSVLVLWFSANNRIRHDPDSRKKVTGVTGWQRVRDQQQDPLVEGSEGGE